MKKKLQHPFDYEHPLYWQDVVQNPALLEHYVIQVSLFEYDKANYRPRSLLQGSFNPYYGNILDRRWYRPETLPELVKKARRRLRKDRFFYIVKKIASNIQRFLPKTRTYKIKLQNNRSRLLYLLSCRLQSLKL